jgi:hypothetical protein
MKIIGQLLCLLALFALCTGCKKFQSERVIDFAPFAEQTIASVSTLDANLARRRRVLIVDYSRSYDEEAVAEFDRHIKVLESILEEMIEYSVLVAKLTHSEATEPEQVQLLADYLARYRDAMKAGALTEDLDVEEFDRILENVRQQPTMLSAMNQAQPLINEAGRLAAVTTGRIRDIVSEYDESITDEIEADFGDVLAYRKQYELERRRLLDALAGIYRFRQGEEGALDEVFASGVFSASQKEMLEQSGNPVDASAEAMLISRFESLKKVADRLQPDFDHYIALQREVDASVAEFDEELRATWGVIFVWTRAHAKMAQGVIDPAEWFDMNDAPGTIFRLAGAAI